MKLLHSLKFIVGACLMSGCVKEELTVYYASLNNTTNHTVVIQPYFGNNVPVSKVITLLPGDKKEIANGSYRGIGDGAGFMSDYFSGADSLQVVFDNVDSISHYFNTPAFFAPKYYLNTSTRNLGNPESYMVNRVDVSRNKRENTFIYYFTEQDYLDAQ